MVDSGFRKVMKAIIAVGVKHRSQTVTETGLGLTQRRGQRCPLLRVRAGWTRDPETWRSFYTLLYKPDLIWLALSCGDRNNSHVCPVNQRSHQNASVSLPHPTYAEYVRVRLVGSGLGSSLGWGGFLSLSHTWLPSRRKGKDSCRGVRGEASGSEEGSAAPEASESDIVKGIALLSVFSVFSSGSHPLHGSLYAGVGGGGRGSERRPWERRRSTLQPKMEREALLKNLLCGWTRFFFFFNFWTVRIKTTKSKSMNSAER